ncbi:MAG: DUF2177 family protein [Rhizomicrobium sp.]
MFRYTFGYLAVLFTLLAGDAAWLSYFAPAVFRPTLGDILLAHPRWAAAIVFYLLYSAGILAFPVALAARQSSWLLAIAYGAAFGFLAYMTYDLTNLATIKVWNISLAMTDIGWGTVLTCAATLVGFEVIKSL